MALKIAFLFLTLFEANRERAWNNFFKSQEKFSSVHIQTKKNAPYGAKNEITLPSGWDHLVRTAMSLLGEALNDSSNEKFIFASEASVPGRPFAETYDEIIANPLAVFGYAPNRDAKQGAEGVQWVVLDKKHAELLVENENHMRGLLLSDGKKSSPATFLNFSNLLKKTALSLKQIDSKTTFIPAPKPTIMLQEPKISPVEFLCRTRGI